MLKSLSVKNFRQFQELNIESLNRVNLIVGQNNTGKTAILEALYLLFAQPELLGTFPSTFRSPHGNSSDNFESFWRWLPYQKDRKSGIEVKAAPSNGPPYSVCSSSNSSAHLNLQYFNLDRPSAHSLYNFVIQPDGKVRQSERDITLTGAYSPWPKVSTFSIYPLSPPKMLNYLITLQSNVVDVKN